MSLHDRLQRDAAKFAYSGNSDRRATSASDSNSRPTIPIDPEHISLADTFCQLTDELVRANRYYVRADQLVRVNGDDITSIMTASELAGAVSQHVEICLVIHRKDEAIWEHRPLPTSYANTYLNNQLERCRFQETALFSRVPIYADHWRLVPPGYDATSKICYTGPKVEPREGTDHLDALLHDFCFLSETDRTNDLNILITQLASAHFVGCKPALILDGNQPAIGKTVLAQLISILRDGRREIPLYDVLVEPLQESFDEAAEGSVYVISKHRSRADSKGGWRNTNLRKPFSDIIRKAGLEPWPKLWHALRASFETELVERTPIQSVARFMGHSPRVAVTNYLRPLPEHIDQARSLGIEAHQKAHQHNSALPCIQIGEDENSRENNVMQLGATLCIPTEWAILDSNQ